MNLVNKYWFPYAILTALAVAIYFPTINFDYVLDDKIVFTENKYVKEGLSGIPKILGSDSFEGYFGEQKDLLPGARYRPLSLVTFALEYELFGINNRVSHILNVLLYIICCVLLYLTLNDLFGRIKLSKNTFFILITAVLFAIHPIHVEAVANVKGRDEIMALIFSLLALKFSLSYFKTSEISQLLLASVSLFLGLLSKENALTFLAVIPFSLFLFAKGSRAVWLKLTAGLLLCTAIYIAIRYNAVGYFIGTAESTQLMNNPFIYMSVSQKYATIFYTLLFYFKLGFLPNPLTHDYYPFHIPTMQWGDITPILSVGLYIFIGLLALFFTKKNKIISWASFYYIATLSIVSNLVLNVGTFMNERFLFMPSVAFALVVSYFFSRFFQFKNNLIKYLAIAFISILCIGYTAKSIMRVPDWKDTFTLNSSAVKVSKNSARANLFMGTAYFNLYKASKNDFERSTLLNSADQYISRSFELFPRYGHANQMMAGVAAEKFKIDSNIEQLLQTFTEIIKQRPDTKYVRTYLEYLNGQRQYAQSLIDFYYRIGHDELYARQKRNEWAIQYLKYGLIINENDRNINLALSKAYQALNRPQEAEYYQTKALGRTHEQ